MNRTRHLLKSDKTGALHFRDHLKSGDPVLLLPRYLEHKNQQPNL